MNKFTFLALLSLIATAQAREPALLPTDSIQPALILIQPAASGTSALAQELALMRQIAKDRTPAQIEQAVADDADESMFIFARVLGPKFNAATLPLTAALSAKVQSDSSWVGAPAKTVFLRPHPYHADTQFPTVCPTKTKHDSYPSGHTLAGYMQALVLIDMVPERQEAILQRAADFAHNRVVCGVNYPSDLEASRLLAYSAYAVIRNQPAYQQEVKAARLEVRRALNLPL
jgi:acid phosphatase (class A)